MKPAEVRKVLKAAGFDVRPARGLAWDERLDAIDVAKGDPGGHSLIEVHVHHPEHLLKNRLARDTRLVRVRYVLANKYPKHTVFLSTHGGTEYDVGGRRDYVTIDPPLRSCRSCGARERRGFCGFTNMTTYLGGGVCVDCLNRSMRAGA
jgi:hypothetical protein